MKHALGLVATLVVGVATASDQCRDVLDTISRTDVYIACRNDAGFDVGVATTPTVQVEFCGSANCFALYKESPYDLQDCPGNSGVDFSDASAMTTCFGQAATSTATHDRALKGSSGSSLSASSSASSLSWSSEATSLEANQSLSASSSSPNSAVTQEAENDDGSSSTISIAVAIVGCLIGAVGCAMAVEFVYTSYCRRRKGAHNRDHHHPSSPLFNGPATCISTTDNSLPSAQKEPYTELSGENYSTRSTMLTTSTTVSTNTTDSNNASSRALHSLRQDDELVSVRVPLDKVTFDRLLNRSRYGEVHLGVYREQFVAIKRLRPETTQHDPQHLTDFVAEAKAMVALQHDRIVGIVGVAWDSMRDFCVLSEYMAGGDLRTLLNSIESEGEARPRGFNDTDKIRIALHVAHGLSYLHSLCPEVLHRDLKSRNVLLDDQLNAKLSDFGVSRERSEGTMTACVGTSLWMAPEVLTGSPYDAKADVFSFGVLLSELDQHTLPYAHAQGPHSRTKLPDTAILHRVTQGLLRVAFTGDNENENEHEHVQEEGDPEREGSLMAQLGRECVALNPADRPNTNEVLYRVHMEWMKRPVNASEFDPSGFV